jgi:predicted tellurium resistance membrane protein TerC
VCVCFTDAAFSGSTILQLFPCRLSSSPTNQNPVVVFTSNIFAIMGLRSLYTILSKAATDLKYLEPAVALVLGFIGAKMIAEYFDYLIPTNIALAVVATLLGSGVGLSVLEKQKELEEEDIAVDDKRKSS